jgi:hypothetical protein
MALFQPFTPVMAIDGIQPASHFRKITYGWMMIPSDEWNRIFILSYLLLVDLGLFEYNCVNRIIPVRSYPLPSGGAAPE